MNETLIALLGSGTVGIIITAFLNHKAKTDETKKAKEDKAFEVLEGRIKHLENEMSEIKMELKIERETVAKLREENISLKFENQNLKEEIEELKGRF